MEKVKIQELLEEIKSLHACYLKLDEWFSEANNCDEKKAADYGKLVIAEKLRNLLDQDDIFPIVSSGNPYSLEDFYFYVKQDIPQYISKIEEYLENN